MRRTLVFNGSAEWVVDGAVDDLARYTKATATVKRNENVISGTLTLEAASEADLDAAVRFLNRSSIYRSHFKVR